MFEWWAHEVSVGQTNVECCHS